MIPKKFIIMFLIVIPSMIIGQFDIDKHMLGPSFGFSFLGSSVQFGINHEYGINIQELGIANSGKLGVGGIFRYLNYTENFTHIDWEYTDIILGVQTNYHFYIANEDLDPWFGLVFAYDFGYVDDKIKISGVNVENKSYGGFWLAVNAGMRYWLNEKFAINARIGFGTLNYSALDLGIDYKFN
jgi:hypothetical protein